MRADVISPVFLKENETAEKFRTAASVPKKGDAVNPFADRKKRAKIISVGDNQRSTLLSSC